MSINDLEEADRLNEQVKRLAQEKKYEEAIPYAKKVLEIREKELEKDHHDVVASLFNLALLYRFTDRDTEVDILYERALEIAEAIGGRDIVALYIKSEFTRQCVKYEFEENWSEAINAYQETRAHFKLEQMTEVGWRLYTGLGWHLALCLKNANRWEEALELQEENFMTFKKLGRLKREADVYMEIGHLHQLLDNYEESWLHYLDAYRLYSRVDGGKGHKLGMASASEALGTLEFYARMLPQSVKDLEEAHKLYESLDLPEKVASAEKTLKEARKALKEEEPITIS